ncbi:tetratricopeptide repeat protein [Thalassotalea euphylliae]|uniref:tetratricopeptide repeat protein n=1 Tax=Thalassotalea euphylliae TaxID=1655234 RepID=UPI00363FC403
MALRIISVAVIALLSTLSFSATSGQLTRCDTESCVAYFDKFVVGAKRGNAQAMATLGQFYYFGYGTNVDHEKAVGLFKKAARLGNVAAMYRLGLYYLGDNPDKDLPRGLKHLEKASFHGHEESTFLLAIAYLSDEFGATDKEKADKYLSKAYQNRHQKIPAVVDMIAAKEKISTSNYPRLYNSMDYYPLVKTDNNKSKWAHDDIEVITVVSPPLTEILDDQALAFRRPAKTTGSRLPSLPCRLLPNCQSADNLQDIEDMVNFASK